MENWLEFRDTFNTLVHSNDKLSNVQKILYLLSSLDKNVLQIIKSI